MCVCATHATGHKWRSEDHCMESVLSPPRGFWDQAKVVRLVHQALDLLSHLTIPIAITFEPRHPMHVFYIHSTHPAMAVIISSLSTESSGAETYCSLPQGSKLVIGVGKI